MGAWIETRVDIEASDLSEVAPRVGAWIETNARKGKHQPGASRPAWARGLKRRGRRLVGRFLVAPRVGAWIETPAAGTLRWCRRRAPRGRVD